MFSEGKGSSGDYRSGFTTTSSPTDMDCLTNLEMAVSDSLSVMRNCLLYMPRPTADRTLPWIIADRDKYA
jgi:hypothetical protein